MNRILNLGVIAAFAATGALGACYSAPVPGVTYVTTAPPASRVEVIPTSPGTGYVWVGGHWGWANNTYTWVPGSWVVPAAHYSVWVPGGWHHDHHGWFYRTGHWR